MGNSNTMIGYDIPPYLVVLVLVTDIPLAIPNRDIPRKT